MAESVVFKLDSNETAIALIIPSELRKQIDDIRGKHDKSFKKWTAHINLLYPSVTAARLSAAVDRLRHALHTAVVGSIIVEVNHVDHFRHRKNATVILRPSSDSEQQLLRLRNLLVASLGCQSSDGTVEGVYRPHITLGQAPLFTNAIDTLKDKARQVQAIKWEATALAVLRRKATGEMAIVDQLQLSTDSIPMTLETQLWTPCYRFCQERGWRIDFESQCRPAGTLERLNLISYNLLADPSAPPFSVRLPVAMETVIAASSACSAVTKVLCLQEINEESLPLLLADNYIQRTFPYCSHCSTSSFQSKRNLVTFASVPFVHYRLGLNEPHKSALIASFPSLKLAAVNVHLTSALTDRSVQSKISQMARISSFISMSQELQNFVVVLAGDFNLTSSTQTMKSALSRGIITRSTADEIEKVIDRDTWTDTFVRFAEASNAPEVVDSEEGEAGATFDRLNNPLAALSPAPIDERPQRYDRIIFQTHAHIQVDNFARFGFPNENQQCASDHYCISATLSIGHALSNQSASANMSASSDTKDILLEDDTDIQNLLADYLPSSEDIIWREQAIENLRQTLTRNDSLKSLVFAPLGSYAMGTYFATSDVDILAIGTVPWREFFTLAISSLRSLAERRSHCVHYINSLVPIIEVTVAGIKFDIQYCQAVSLLKRLCNPNDKEELESMILDPNLVGELLPDSARPLNTYRDTVYLIRSQHNLNAFREAHRFLSLYLRRRGLYSAKFGYLGGIHLSLMLNRVLKLINVQYGRSAARNSATLVRSFLNYYAAYNWQAEVVADPVLHAGTQYTRSAKQAIVIRALHSPTARPNVASSCTQLAAKTLNTEFRLAAEKVAEGNWSWCLREDTEVVSDFLDGYGAFVKVSLDIWNVNEAGSEKVREVVGGLESKIPALLVSLGRLENVSGRAWPGRFRETIKPDAPNDATQFRGHYLVGIRASDDQLNAGEKTLIESKVITAVRSFQQTLRESKTLSNDWCYVDVAVVPRKKILAMSLAFDDRDWTASSSLDAPYEAGHNDAHDDVYSGQSVSSTATNRQPSSSKLRPAQDILSRIRWDPGLSVDDYLIGYEDRFLGVKEMPLSKWKSDQTDLEFIPMHRIVWVRKAEDDEVIWDRKRRIDKICGSGRR